MKKCISAINNSYTSMKHQCAPLLILDIRLPSVIERKNNQSSTWKRGYFFFRIKLLTFIFYSSLDIRIIRWLLLLLLNKKNMNCDWKKNIVNESYQENTGMLIIELLHSKWMGNWLKKWTKQILMVESDKSYKAPEMKMWILRVKWWNESQKFFEIYIFIWQRFLWTIFVRFVSPDKN